MLMRRKAARRLVAATLSVACLVAGATAQARVAVSNMHVHCYQQQETGQDEIYMKFNGNRVNMGDFETGWDRTFSTVLLLSSFPVTAEFWESDGDHWYDRDDLMDSVTETSAGNWGGMPFSYLNYHYNYQFTLTVVP